MESSRLCTAVLGGGGSNSRTCDTVAAHLDVSVPAGAEHEVRIRVRHNALHGSVMQTPLAQDAALPQVEEGDVPCPPAHNQLRQSRCG